MLTKIQKEAGTINEQEIPLDECVQLGDAVKIDGERGFVIGEIGGQIIVQLQGNTKLINPNKVTPEKKEPLSVTPDKQFKFDKVSQKLLFEQLVKCAIYLGQTPIKLTECFVKFADWNNATNEQMINVLIEGNTRIMPKNQIRILEDINEFANPDNYVEGWIIDEDTREHLEEVQINAEDYTQARSDAAPVRIVRLSDATEAIEGQEPETVPRATLTTDIL